jgi:very-short-patch-repair endonuclease
MDRDQAANAALAELHWQVLRFWDFEINKDLDRCVAEIERLLKAGPSGSASN